MGLRGGGTAPSSFHSGREPDAHAARVCRSTTCSRCCSAKTTAGAVTLPFVTITAMSAPCTWRAVPLRTWRSGVPTAEAGQAVAPVFALDHPAAPVGVGGLHIGAEVSAAPDAERVLAAVAAHQVPYGVLEPGVVQGVQLGQLVPQSLRADRLPPGVLPPLVEQAGAGQQRDRGESPAGPTSGPAAS